MTRAPLSDPGAPERFNSTLYSWATQWDSHSALLGIEHQPVADDRGHHHWLVRCKGEERDVITIWFSLRQRTVHVETEVMASPEENLEALFRFALVKNAELRELHLAIGPEDGIYLVTEVPVGELTVERLDEVVGAAVTYVDEIFPTVMAMGLPSLYRRRRNP